jgi:K+-sensing histidine kinase KdpD
LEIEEFSCNFAVGLLIFTIMGNRIAIGFWVLSILTCMLIVVGYYAVHLSVGWLAGFVAVMAGNGIAFICIERKQNKLRDQYPSIRQKKNAIAARCAEIEKKEQALRQEQEALTQLHHIKTRLFQTISGDVQHPLVKLKTKLAALVEEKIDEEQFKREVADLTQMVGDISQLLENLLQWSKYQAQGQPLVPQRHAWEGLIENALHEVKFSADKKKISLESLPAPGVTVFADGDMLKSLLKTLLLNAISVMGEDNAIVFSTACCDDATEIQVLFRGNFPLRKIFVESFSGESYNSFQPEMARSFSLGWMFCKAVVADNGGTIRLIEAKEDAVAIGMQFPTK